MIEPRTTGRLFGGLSGLALLCLFTVHYVVSGVLPTGRFPTPFDSEAALRAFFVDNQSEIRVLSAVDILTAIVLLAFTGAVVGWLQVVAPERRVAIAVAHGGGIAASVFTGIAGVGPPGCSRLRRCPTTVRSWRLSTGSSTKRAVRRWFPLTAGVLMAAGSIVGAAPRPPCGGGSRGSESPEASSPAAAIPAMYWGANHLGPAGLPVLPRSMGSSACRDGGGAHEWISRPR